MTAIPESITYYPSDGDWEFTYYEDSTTTEKTTCRMSAWELNYTGINPLHAYEFYLQHLTNQRS